MQTQTQTHPSSELHKGTQISVHVTVALCEYNYVLHAVFKDGVIK